MVDSAVKQQGIDYPNGSNPIEWLTRDSLFVDKDGTLYAGFVKGHSGESQQVWNHLGDIDTAIWQCWHIIEGYLGQYLGLGRRRTRTEGELHQIKRLAKELLYLAAGLLGDKQVESYLSSSPEQVIDAVLTQIGRVSNEHKAFAQLRLKHARAQKPTDPSETVAKVAPAAGNLAERATEILVKCQGIKVRLGILLAKRRKMVTRLVNLYQALDQLRKKMLRPMIEWDDRDLAAVVRDFDPTRTGKLAALDKVNALPYSKRVRSREIRRLTKIPGYIAKRDFISVDRAIRGAMGKLERVVAEVDPRFQPKVLRIPPQSGRKGSDPKK